MENGHTASSGQLYSLKLEHLRLNSCISRVSRARRKILVLLPAEAASLSKPEEEDIRMVKVGKI